MSAQEKIATLEMLEQMEQQLEVEAARDDLIAFANVVYPNYAAGAHHRHVVSSSRTWSRGARPGSSSTSRRAT